MEIKKRKPLSEETKNKISVAQKSKKFSEEHLRNLRIANSKPRTEEHKIKLGLARKGKPSWNKGIKGSVPGKSLNPVVEEERRRKISESHKGMANLWCRGKNHWNFKNYENRYPYSFVIVKPLIYDRDKQCVKCCKNRDETRIVVHHIDHCKQNNNLDNLVLLCHSCNVLAESRKNKEIWPIILIKYVQEMNRLYEMYDVLLYKT